MGCMPSKSSSSESGGRPTPVISWPTECYRNPGVLPSALAIGYPYPYPDGYPNTPPPFPIPDTSACNCRKLGADCCDTLHGLGSRDARRRGGQNPGPVLKLSKDRD